MSTEAATVTRDSVIILREITSQTLPDFLRLSKTLTEWQQKLVADNAVSIAQAHFEPYAWFRGIYADETPVGFIMLYIGPDNVTPGNPKVWFLWRFMMGGPYQKMGFGRKTLDIIFDMVREQGGTELLVSCEPGPEGPEEFYRKLGFVPNGRTYDGELGMVVSLH